MVRLGAEQSPHRIYGGSVAPRGSIDVTVTHIFPQSPASLSRYHSIWQLECCPPPINAQLLNCSTRGGRNQPAPEPEGGKKP